MTKRLGQPGSQFHLCIIMGVNIDKPRHHPPTGRIDDAVFRPNGKRCVADSRHPMVFDGHVSTNRRLVRTGKNGSILNDDTLVHQMFSQTDGTVVCSYVGGYHFDQNGV